MTSKPKRLSVPNAEAAAYNLYVGNAGARRESFSYQVVLTTGGAASQGQRTLQGPD